MKWFDVNHQPTCNYQLLKLIIIVIITVTKYYKSIIIIFVTGEILKKILLMRNV